MVGIKRVKNVPELRSLMEKKKAVFRKLLVRNIKLRLLEPEVLKSLENAVIRVIFDMQAEYFTGVGAADDPTIFSVHEEEIRREVQEQVAQSATRITPENIEFGINLTLLSDEFIGVSSSPSKTGPEPPIRWLVFFLSGAPLGAGLYWVPADAAKALKMSDSEGTLGRFGAGFLIHSDVKEVSAKNKSLKKRGVNSRIVLHPQSGNTGNPAWFANVLSSVNVESLIIKPAVRETMSQLHITK
jgi:hypothetical protein